MVTVICYDAWSCPKSYLVIRKQPLRQEGFLFISLMTLDSLPHVLSPTSLRQQHNEVACLLQLQNLRWHCRQQIVLKWAIPHFNWDTKLVRKYWTLKSSPIRRPRIWEFNWQWSITSVSWLVCAKSCSFCLFFFLCMCVSSYYFTSLPLLQDLLNFDDPLNIDAAEHHLRDKVRPQCSEEIKRMKYLGRVLLDRAHQKFPPCLQTQSHKTHEHMTSQKQWLTDM